MVALAAAAALAPGRAAEIMAPKRFPTWQTWNVAFPFVVLEKGEYRMYYTGTGADQLGAATSDFWATGLATSRDGQHWREGDEQEPVLAPPRLREGQLVPPPSAGPFDARQAFGAWVARDGAGWTMWYTGWSGERRSLGPGLSERVGFRIGLARSPDGRRFEKVPGPAGAGAVLGPGPSPEDGLGVGQPALLREGPAWLMWYEGYDGRAWRIFRATSGDSRAWHKQGLALGLGEPGSLDERGARNPVVLRRGGGYELWYQGLSARSPGIHVLRATSPDGLAWTRRGEVPLHLDPPLASGEEVHVDSVVPRPDGSCQVFFARERTESRPTSFGEVPRRGFSIFTEVVAP